MSGYGSGVIFDVRGTTAYIVTNHHVVENTTRVNVTVRDSRVYEGEVLGLDSVRDLAVVRICCGGFEKLDFGNPAALDPGDEVVAMGYPLGFSGSATVTRGIVSAFRYDSPRRSDVIQTDAPLNPGNSGGPLLSLDGEILGINTYGYDTTEDGRPVEGVSFAVSAETVAAQVRRLISAGARATPTPTPTPERS